MNKNKGFTFIELLLVIAILSIITWLIMPNILNALKKGRDARRKTDLNEIKTALEMYYEDNKSYPDSIPFGSSFTNPDATKIYLQKIPDDPLSASDYRYNYCTDTTNQMYQLYSVLENAQDPQIITPPPLANCVNNDCGTDHVCNYGVSSSNASP